jgi:hypothetical protein
VTASHSELQGSKATSPPAGHAGGNTQSRGQTAAETDGAVSATGETSTSPPSKPSRGKRRRGQPQLPKRSRRCSKRSRQLATCFKEQLLSAVALCTFAGPHHLVTDQEWDEAVTGAERGKIKAQKILRSDTRTCDSFRRKSVLDPPSWLRVLHRASSIRDEVKRTSALLDQVRQPVQRLCRNSCGEPTDKNPTNVPVVLRDDGYTVGRDAQAERFRKVNPKNLDIPNVGDGMLDPLEHVAYPFDKLFSEPYLRRCMVDEPPKIKGHRSLNLDEGVTRGELLAALKHMLFFSDDPEVLDTPTNGLFALLKSLDEDGDEHHRLVFDGVQGNKFFSMAKFQELYEELVAADPERAAAIGCGPKVMNIGSPADFTDLPGGVRSRSSGDMKNYFYQFAQLAFLLRYQGLFNVKGEEVGRPDVPLLRVGLKVLGMGSWIAALVAHTVHWCILHRGLVDKPLRLARPEFASHQHKEDLQVVARLAAESQDGLVAWTEVPPRMRRRFVEALPEGEGVGSDRLAALRVPPQAFACEPLADVSHLAPSGWVRLSTSLIGGSRNGRAAVMAMRRRNERERVEEYMGLASVYCDDQHTFLYGPEHAPWGELDDQLANAHRLMVVLVSDHAGLLQNFSKLKWANRETSPLLGIDTEFLDDGNVRFAMSPERRRRLKDEIKAIVRLARRGARFVCEDQLQSVLGDLVWCFLVRRPLLSAIRVFYRAMHSPNRPPGLVRLEKSLVRELDMLDGLVPFAETTTKEFTSTLWTFDASGVSKHGNGGFGVAYREGLTQEVATEITTPFGATRLAEFRVQPDGCAPADRLVHGTRKGPAARAAHFLRFSYKRGKRDWKIAREGEFDFPPRMVLKAESISGTKAYDCASRRKSDRGKLVACVGDNTGSLHGLTKGRSSVKDLNRICQRLAALQIIRDVEARWAWINSKANPSDYPSRLWIKRKLRRWHEGGFPPRGDPGGRRLEREYHMVHFDRRSRGRDPRQATEWLRDLVAENGEAKNPGPYSAVITYHETLEERVRALAGAGALIIPSASTKDPYKGVLPSAGAMRPSLVGAKISVDSLRRYVKAFSGFSFYLRMHWELHDSYADHVFEFVNMAFETGHQTKSGIQLLLAFFPFICDDHKAITSRAYQALKSWKAAVPTQSHPPLPWPLALLFAWDLVNSRDPGDVDTGLGLLVAHHVYARGGELDALTVNDVVQPDEAQAVSDHAQVIFRKTKAGRPQTATVDDSFIGDVLKFAVERARGREPGSRNPRVFCFGKRGFLHRFKAAQLRRGYTIARFVRHSARHGGATRDFAKRLRDEHEISSRLRHATSKTTKIYLQDAAVLAIMEQVPDRATQLIVRLGGSTGMINQIATKLRLHEFAVQPSDEDLRALVHSWNLTLTSVEIREYLDGRAVFTTRPVGAGQILGKYEGERLSKVEKEIRYPEDDAAFLLGPVEQVHAEPVFIDAVDPFKSNWTRFVNDCSQSSPANVMFVQGPAGTSTHQDVWIHATEDILPGTQLRVDYGDSYWWKCEKY